MAEENQNTEAQETTEAPAAAADQPVAPSLGVADLQNAAQVIDLAMQRGAFRAAEAAQVGVVYNRLTAFITSVQDQQKDQTEDAAAEETA
jgi:hypothetical protein